MSLKFFKNTKHARRRLPEVFVCIQAVDKKLKPSYLWDAFCADATEIKMYLEELHLLKMVDHNLDIFHIGETVFVTQYDTLKDHIDYCASDNLYLINVSENVDTPFLLTTEEKTEALKPIIKCSREILNYLQNKSNGVYENDIDYSLCNQSTLFGVLLGYPILYWFSPQSPYSEFSCLSMTPLKVYKIITRICLPSDCIKKVFNSRSMPENHELFSFSIPDILSKEAESVVKNWFDMLTDKSKSISFFNDLQIRTDIISLPSVSM